MRNPLRPLRSLALLLLVGLVVACSGGEKRRVDVRGVPRGDPAKTPDELLREADRAWAYRGRDGAKETISRCRAFLRLRKEDPRALWRLARAYYYHADYFLGPARTNPEKKLPYLRQGLEHARKALKSAPNLVEARFWTGILLARVCQIEGLVRSLPRLGRIRHLLRSSLESRHETNAPAHAALAVIEMTLRRKGLLWVKGDLTVAADHLATATRLRPRASLAWILLAETYRLQGRRRAAYATLRYALELNPEERLGKWYPDAQRDESLIDRRLARKLLATWRAEDGKEGAR